MALQVDDHSIVHSLKSLAAYYSFVCSVMYLSPPLTRNNFFYGDGKLATQWLKHYHIIISGHEYTLEEYLDWLDLLLHDNVGV